MENDTAELEFFQVQTLDRNARPFITHEDRHVDAAKAVSKRLRDRPTLPCDPGNPKIFFKDIDSGILFPLAHCAFSGCEATFTELHALQEHINQKHHDHIHFE